MVGAILKIRKWVGWKKLFRRCGIWAEICSLYFTQVYKWVYESEGGSAWVRGERTFLAEQTHVQMFTVGEGQWGGEAEMRSVLRSTSSINLTLAITFIQITVAQTLTSPFISIISNTAWLHYHILSGLTIHYWGTLVGKFLHLVTLGNVTICTKFVN